MEASTIRNAELSLLQMRAQACVNLRCSDGADTWFASPGAALRATLLLESPAAFRERNFFVSENALERA